MGQVTLYLDAQTERRVAQAARRAKLSKSRWVSGLIHEKIHAEWPDEFLKLAGAFPDFPTVAQLRAANGKDHPRIALP